MLYIISPKYNAFQILISQAQWCRGKYTRLQVNRFLFQTPILALSNNGDKLLASAHWFTGRGDDFIALLKIQFVPKTLGNIYTKV